MFEDLFKQKITERIAIKCIEIAFKPLICEKELNVVLKQFL